MTTPITRTVLAGAALVAAFGAAGIAAPAQAATASARNHVVVGTSQADCQGKLNAGIGSTIASGGKIIAVHPCKPGLGGWRGDYDATR